jgi:hypothetical protein
VRLRATISQRTDGATANGSWSGRCTGSPRRWKTIAKVTHGPSFVGGFARGAGLAVIRHAGTPVNRIKWQSPLTLSLSSGANTEQRAAC